MRTLDRAGNVDCSRARSDEQRFVTLGRWRGEVVVLVYTERLPDCRSLSLRKAEKYETRFYIAEAKRFQGQSC